MIAYFYFKIIFNYIPIADIRQPVSVTSKAALRSLHLLYDLSGRFNTGFCRIVAGKHAGDFKDVFTVRKAAYLGDRPTVGFLLIDEEMVVGNGRRLRQVGDTENLSSAGEFPDMVGDLKARLTADADVNFIENHGLIGILAGPGRLQGQGNTRDFTAGGIFAKGCIASPVLAEK